MELMLMPDIKPISDIINYTEVLSQVKENSAVYLTKNGRGEFSILRLEELDKLKATIRSLECLLTWHDFWISTRDFQMA